MLGRLRSVLEPLSSRLGSVLGRLGLTPNELTVLGALTALLTPIAGYLGVRCAVPALIAISAALDWLDGAVARATSKTTRLGGFIDSFCDRVSDAAFIASLYFLGINIHLVLIAIPVSFLVSYVRCRAEALGVNLEGVGYVERGERVAIVLAASVTALTIGVTLSEYVLIALVALSTLTIIQRLVRVIRVLR